MPDELFKGAYKLTPFGDLAVVELLWDQPLPEPVRPGSYPIITIGGILSVGRIESIGEQPPEAKASEKLDLGQFQSLIEKILNTSIISPDVVVGNIVVFQSARAQTIPVEGYERNRLIPLSSIMAKLE